MEQSLNEVNDILEMTIESIGDSVITTDNTGIITTFNKAAENLTEWTRESAIGIDFNKIFTLINFKSREVIQISFNEIIRKKKSVGFKEDTVLISKSGKEYFVSATISNITNKQNNIVIGVVILLRDITKLKMLENEVRHEKEKAQAANVAKSAFLASMSHEIRTPLNGIEGMIDMTLLTNLTDEQKENLLIAKECSNSLMEVINNILDFSKIEAGKMVVKNTQFYLNDLIDRTVKTNIIHAKEKEIEFISKVNSGLTGEFTGDSGKIQQILNNLVSNAIKFTSQGSVSLETEKLSEDEKTMLLRFSVTDTGIGISSEDIDKLFKSFSQVDGTYTRKYGGTGLGLIISKRLAQLIGGEIHVESIKDKGSKFSLILKVEKFLNVNNNEIILKEDKDENNITGISRKILIVEDNEANQIVLSRMCSVMNHRIKLADNGLKALEILSEETFDLILMDIQMPMMNGVEATKIIREKEKKSGAHIPIIALTAYALFGDREKFLKIGMDDYLPKPINLNDLHKCIEKAIMKEKNNELYHDALYYLNIKETDNNLEDQKEKIKRVSIEINKFKSLIFQENYKGCENSSHILKELSLNMKSVIMKNASFRAELAARRKDMNGLNEQIRIIEDEYKRIKKTV